MKQRNARPSKKSTHGLVRTIILFQLHVASLQPVAVLRSGQGALAPKSCPGPPNDKLLNAGQLDTEVLLLVDVIGSIVISLAVVASQMMRGQAPSQMFFPRTAPA